MFIVWHWVLNLSCPFSVAKSSVQYDLLQRPIILLPINSTLKSPGVCLPWGGRGDKPVMLALFKFFTESGFNFVLQIF